MIPDSLDSHADGKILSGQVDQIGYLVINNPQRHNAIGLDMWQAAAAALEQLAADPDTRLLVVSGSGGKAFASGADISKFESERSTKADVELYQATSGRFYTALNHFPKPTIAAIREHDLGLVSIVDRIDATLQQTAKDLDHWKSGDAQTLVAESSDSSAFLRVLRARKYCCT